MLTEEQIKDLMKQIELSGSVDDAAPQQRQIILGSRNNLNHIAGRSSGKLKIYPSVAKKFELILMTPEALKALSPFEIRCVMCKRVISYPAWYYSKKYDINHFHYFVCASRSSLQSNIPTTECYRP